MCYCKPEVKTPYCIDCPWKMMETIKRLEQEIKNLKNSEYLPIGHIPCYRCGSTNCWWNCGK